MYNVLFVCHGNICRSAMAEYMFRDYVLKNGLSNKIHVESRATSSEELGNPIYPNVKRILDNVKIDSSSHRAKKIQYSDYDNFDIIIGFDSENIYNLKRLFNNQNKIFLFTFFSKKYKDEIIDDPWYTRDFDITYEMILDSEKGLLDYIKSKL